MGLPLEYENSKPGTVFEALSTQPERLQLDAFLYGIAHQCHLASEVSNIFYNFNAHVIVTMLEISNPKHSST